MEKQNAKIRKEFEVAERKRMRKLVDTAERLDPRIRAEKDEKEAKRAEEKARRAQLKQDEEDAKRRIEEDKLKREEDEKADREAKEKAEREQNKENKQIAKGLRQRLKKASGLGKLSKAEAEELQELGLALEAEPLEALCVRIECLGSAREVERVVRDELVQFNSRRALEQQESLKQKEEARKVEEKKALQAKEAAAAAATGAPWSMEEMGALSKGLQKFPGGTGGRWAIITQLLNAAGHERTEAEVVAKTQEMSKGQSLRSVGSVIAAGTGFQAGRQSDKKDSVTAKCAALAKAATPSESSAPAAAKASSKVPKAAAETSGEASGAATNGYPVTNSSSPAVAAAPSEDPQDWSSDEQKALEVALQKYPASLDKNERWRSIAEDVPGKTKAQCVERFKFLRAQVTKAK